MAHHHDAGVPSPALLRLLGLVTLLALAPLLVLAWVRAFFPAARPARVRDLHALRLEPVVLDRPEADREQRVAI